MKQIERRCQCTRMGDILCGNDIDAEDLRCPICRKGCNVAMSAKYGDQIIGNHYRWGSITSEFTIKI